MAAPQTLQQLQRQAIGLNRMTQGLQRTLSQLDNMNRTSPQNQTQPESSERKYFTSAQAIHFRDKLKDFRETIVNQANVIKTLKTTFREQLLSIKKDLLVPSAQATHVEFRDQVRDYLLKIKSEIEQSQKECETSQKTQQSSKNMILWAKVENILQATTQIRTDFLNKEKAFVTYKEQVLRKLNTLRDEVQSGNEEHETLQSKCKQYEKQIRLLTRENEIYKKGLIIPSKLQERLTSELSILRDEVFDMETENKALKMDNMKGDVFSPEYDIEHSLFIKCVDMHTGGEPLRIIDRGEDGGIPLDLQTSGIENLTLLKKRDYMLENLDNYRKFLMHEPRGHSGMYGAIITKSEHSNDADFGVLFMHNEGYSTMCGHAVIALARYAIDSGKVVTAMMNGGGTRTNDEKSNEDALLFGKSRLVRIQTPCGIVAATVEIDSNNKTTGNVSFLSAPGWAEQLDQTVDVDKYGSVKYDIGYGGAYYAILAAKSIGLSVTKSSVKELINGGTMISNKVRNELKSNGLTHPSGKCMEFLYGTILIDEGSGNNITIFADRQVDRCPTGSGVIARLAVENAKKSVKLNEKRQYIGPTGSVFTGFVKENGFSFQDKNNCVRVQVSGNAFYVGSSRLFLEKNDNLGKGFLLR